MAYPYGGGGPGYPPPGVSMKDFQESMTVTPVISFNNVQILNPCNTNNYNNNLYNSYITRTMIGRETCVIREQTQE